MLVCIIYVGKLLQFKEAIKKNSLFERFKLSQRNPIYLASTRLNQSAKATNFD